MGFLYGCTVYPGPIHGVPVPLRYLFVDMDSFFASVEQEDDPSLRGRPVAVVPVKTDSTCCIAASKEAKARGVKTGTPVWQARQLCPGIVFVEGRPERYVRVHHRIVEAVGRCLPVGRVMSVDEMACKLAGDERNPEAALALGRRVKEEVRRKFEHLTCSVGIGPNVMLAKVAADLEKPDGLTVIDPRDLPGRLYPLKLTDFPGIGPRMEQRLHKFGVTTTRQLIGLTVPALSHVWGSRIHGERWYELLRGEDVYEKPTRRRTLGHSHVLPPELRTDAGAYGVLVRLVHKAAARLRTVAYWTGALSAGVRYEDGTRWDAGRRLGHCQDTLTLLRALADLWADRPAGRRPVQVGLVLSDLVPARSATPSLFDPDRRAGELSHVMDRVNREFGRHALRFGALCGSEDTAPTRIGFTQVPSFDRTVS
jgi:DNA polymerase-4